MIYGEQYKMAKASLNNRKTDIILSGQKNSIIVDEKMELILFHQQTDIVV